MRPLVVFLTSTFVPKDWPMVLELRKNLVSDLEERLRSLTQQTSALEEELSRHKKRYLDEARAFQHKLKSCQEEEGLYEAARKANLFN